MGYAIFPLRPGGRVLVDATKVVAIQEDPPGDGTGLARLWMASGPSFLCSEGAITVYNRIAQAFSATGNPIGPPS